MSNWCSNVLHIEGKEVGKCLESCLGVDGADDDGKRKFDFDLIVPIPDILKSSGVDTALEHGLIILGHSNKLAQQYLTYKWIKASGITDVEGLRYFLRDANPNAEQVGRKGLEAFA